MPIRLAVFASGLGSNAKNINAYFSCLEIASVVLFCSNNINSGLVSYAKEIQAPFCVFSKKQLNDSTFLSSVLSENSVDFIVLAGFLLKIPAKLISLYPQKIINIHPSLLPKHGGVGMYGNFVHSSVISSGERVSGITIHYVNHSYDEGEIIFQEKCAVSKNETVSSLRKKIRALEHYHFPRVIKKLILTVFS